MIELEFLDLVDVIFNVIEMVLEDVCDVSDLDVECSCSGNVLEIECVDNGFKIIINS